MPERLFTDALFDQLTHVTLFRELDESVLRKIASSSRLLAFPRQASIFLSGEVATELYFVLHGTVKRSILSVDGHERVISIITAGQMFGEAELFGMQRHSAMATTLEPSTILCTDITVIRLGLKQDPVLGLRLIEAMAQRQLEADADIASSLIESVAERVLDFLMRHAGEAETPAQSAGRLVTVYLPASKKVIASRIGITPETLSRSFRELSETGLITVDRQKVTLNLDKIEARAKHGQPQGREFPGWSRDHRRRGNWSARNAPAPVTLNALNKSALQRMLSQRAARSWLMLGRGIFPAQASDTLHRSIALFERYLYDLSVTAMLSESLSAHADLRNVWRAYRKLLGESPSQHTASALMAQGDQVLRAAHQLTKALASEINTESAHYIDIAGRQRMLSQRIAKLFFSVDFLHDRALTIHQLREARHEFSANLKHIHAQVPRGESAIVDDLILVGKSWERLEQALDTEHPDEFVRNAELVVTLTDSILERMDRSLRFLQAKAA